MFFVSFHFLILIILIVMKTRDVLQTLYRDDLAFVFALQQN